MKRWIKMVLNRPWVVIAIVLLLTAITGSFLPRMIFDASIEAMIPDDDPVLADLRNIAEDFGSQELFFIAVQSDNVFSPAVLKKLTELEEALSPLPGVLGVQSPLTAQMVESSFFGIEIGPMTTSLPQTPAEIEKFKKDVLSSPYAGRLITEDGRGAALLLELVDSRSNRSQLLNQIQTIVDGFKGPEQIHIVGDAYILHYTEQAMKQDLINLVPFVIIVITAVLYLTFRSFLGVFIPLATVGASLIWTVGIMTWQEIPVSMISMVMPVILVTLGIASSIHILNKYLEALASGLAKREALEETFRAITSPVIMAALTTAAGFGSLVTAFVHPIREFGVLTAIGVVIAMGLSLSLVPALLILAREPKVKVNKDEKNRGFLASLLDTFTRWAVIYPRKLTVAVLVVLVVFSYGATRLTLESNIVNYFGESSPVKKGTRVIEEVFGGSMQISVVVDTGEEDGLKDPEVLSELIVIQEYLNSWDAINHATSIADIVRELNQALWDGEPEFYAIPETREGVAQQLLLFTMQGGSGLDSLVSYDFSRALVTAQMKTLDAQMMSHVMTEVDNYLAQRYGTGSKLKVRLIGTPKVMLRLMSRYVQTQVSSLVSSTVAVGVIVSLLMKSVALGLLSLVPLLFTVVLNFGIMGYAGLPLDAVTSIIASLAIGIGVDYAIHYTSRYRLELAAGHDADVALRNTGASAGKGIFYNALALVIGFLVLVFSHFRAISVFGFLISLTMIVSSLAALLVIPLLLSYFAKRKIGRGRTMKKTLLLLLSLMLISSVGVRAQERTGQQILDDLSFSTVLSGSGTAELSMITENAKGAQRKFSLKVYLHSDAAGDKQFLEYLAPADVRGTKFLSINEKGQENQMWLYMPALGRERRVASHMTGDSFMGTDFTYDEIGGNFNYDEDYTAQRLADQKEQDVDCYVLDLKAKNATALYEQIQMWVRKDKLVPVKVEFYGSGKTLTKILSLGNFKMVADELIPHSITMADNVKGTKTFLEIVELSQEEINEEVFTVRYLRR